jgi:hypothetical protein
MLPRRRSRAALLAVLALLTSLLLVATPTGSASADTDKGLVTGVLKFPGTGKRPPVKMLWFTKDWGYLGQKKAGAGSYALNLVPGTYWLQFVDQRASYRTDKFAPTDVKVTVRAGEPTIHNVTMQRGAFITGTVRTGNGKLAKGARVAAARTLRSGQNQSYETTANKKGQFAIGGLPSASKKEGWSVFSWDKKKRWVGRSEYVGAIKVAQGKDVGVRLRQRAGDLRVLLYTSGGSLTGRSTVTVTSTRTGQWWSAKATGGTAVFRGLYPGTYTMKFDGTGNWLPSTAKVQGAQVRPGNVVIGKFKVTRRGAWITGQAVDASAPAYPLASSQVQLYDAYGTKIDETTSAADGTFTLDGQLYTQQGMTVVVNPWPERGGYVQTTGYCQFQSTSRPSISVTQGKETALGAVGVTRMPVDPTVSPQCAS